MHVLHILGGLANASGPTHIVLNQARHLVRRGCRVSIFYLTGRGRDTVLPGEGGIAVRGFPVRLLKEWGYAPALRRALDDAMPTVDVVHIHSLWLYLNIAGVLTARRHGVPVLIAPQGALDTWSLARNRGRKRLYAALIERPLLKRASGIQAVSRREVENVREFHVGTPCTIVPNGIEPDYFANRSGGPALRARLGIPPDAPLVLFLGRIHPKKGLDILVNAFRAVAQVRPEARLLVAGTDAGSGYGEVIRRQVRDAGLESRVVWAGEVQGADKLAALDAVDCFALSSHSEGLPVAVLEALASGLPAVITEACNIPEVAEAGAGRVVPLAREAVSSALIELLSDPAARADAARRASALARDCFSWDVVCERLLAVYESMRAERSAPSGQSAT